MCILRKQCGLLRTFDQIGLLKSVLCKLFQNNTPSLNECLVVRFGCTVCLIIKFLPLWVAIITVSWVVVQEGSNFVY